MHQPLPHHTTPRHLPPSPHGCGSFGLSLLICCLWLTAAGCKASEPTTNLVASTPPTPAPEQLASTPTSTPAVPVIPAPSAAPPAVLTESARELVQLAQAQVGDEVLQAYVEGVTEPFELSADDIVYLSDLGVGAETIAAMVRRDQYLRAEPAELEAEIRVSEDAIIAEAPGQASPSAAQELGAPPPSSTAATITQPAAPVTVDYFYNALAPYGSWLEVPEYGWCWQPSVAVVQTDWRPYRQGGRWIWTTNGWYWRSYYSWGWAPFHYGRWHLSSGRGWVWVPDTCWGPAWVTWRYYDGYCGWAPLPPRCVYTSGIGFTYRGSRVGFSFGFGLGASCYSFVPTRCFYTARPWTYCASPTTVNNFYGRTTVINNYINGNNNTIVNRGLGTELVAAASRTEIQKVTLRDAPGSSAGRVVRAERLSRDGSTLTVHRPNLPAQAASPGRNIIDRQEQARSRSASLVQSQAVEAARLNARSTPTRRSLSPSTTTTSPTTRTPRSTNPSANSGILRPQPSSSISSRSTRSEPQVETRTPPARSQPNITRRTTPSRTTLSPRPSLNTGRTTRSQPTSRIEPRRSSATTQRSGTLSRPSTSPSPSITSRSIPSRPNLSNRSSSRSTSPSRTPTYQPPAAPRSTPAPQYSRPQTPPARPSYTPPRTPTRPTPSPSVRSTPAPSSRSTPSSSYRAPSTPAPRAPAPSRSTSTPRSRTSRNAPR